MLKEHRQDVYRNCGCPQPTDIVSQPGIRYDEATGKLEVDPYPLNIIRLKNKPKAWLTMVQDTNSMDPVLDYKHTCLLIAAADDEDHGTLIGAITEGNVVVVQGEDFNIVHRSKQIKQDNQGRRWVLKGDNNRKADSFEVWDEHVKWLIVGTIY